MSDPGVRMYPLNAEQFQALADLARKLDRPLRIDHVVDGPYKIDRNGRCKMTKTIEEDVEL